MRKEIWLLLSMVFYFGMASARAEESQAPIRAKVQGMVCSFCARGIKEVLRKQANVDHFDIDVSAGELLLWAKPGMARPTDAEIRAWIERSGLRLR